MNAKKIMGAVLVALLAAALFVGAGAAADNGTVFMYQKGANLNDGTWTNGAYSVVIKDGNVTSDNFVAGTYKKGDDTLYITYPTAGYSAVGVLGTDTTYIINNNGKVYAGSDVTLTTIVAATLTDEVSEWYVTDPTGKSAKYDDLTGLFADIDDEGVWKVQAIFNKTNFVDGVSDKLLVDTLNSFTFTVVGDDDATISANVDTAYKGNYVTLTVEGTLGTTYYLAGENFEITNDQLVTINTESAPTGKVNYSFEMPNDGIVTIQAKVTGADEATIQLKNADGDIDGAKITITISKPEFTVVLGASSYFIGENIELSGTSTEAVTISSYVFNISGTNIEENGLTQVPGSAKNGKTWEVKLSTADEKLDVGTYTIKIYDGNNDLVKTVAVALKQPFISIIEAPEVIVQGTEAEFVINAEAAETIAWYVFGTNFFENSTDFTKENKNAPNEFTVTLDKYFTSSKNMSTGQYFMVFQHPMYDKVLNIRAVDDGKIYLNTSGTATGAENESFLFDAKSRQTANAAQALCDALDSQNIDDMYVKYSFFVVGQDESFSISEIPTSVAQGETITISGVDTASEEGTPVTVEMISTAFAAVPKETVGSAAFIVVTTEVAEDGTWEITLDTSDLNVDEYSLSVAIGDDVKKNVKINVVEGADTPDTPDTPDVPDTPDTPDTPTEPETPGFGALAALAGLGAVAVLLLRRE